MKTKEDAIEVIKNSIKQYHKAGLSLGEVGSASWKATSLTLDEAKAAGYISALSWAYDITQEDLK